jgi:putative ABC transport system ATP-binding protein
MLELRELVKYHHTGGGEPVRAVDGVSMEVGAGEMVALYGPSGSGKTTLLTVIAALLAPDSGAVLVDGRDISQLSDADAASYRLHELGYVDQSLELLPGGNVVQNAALKLWVTVGVRRGNRQIEPLLVRLGLAQRLRHRADSLSMGERQRVMIARALSTEPKLLLADEPTGNLDTQRSREVLELLREVCRERGTALLLVTHDPQATAYADRVHVLRDGRLAEFDTAAALLTPSAAALAPALNAAIAGTPLAPGTPPAAVAGAGTGADVTATGGGDAARVVAAAPGAPPATVAGAGTGADAAATGRGDAAGAVAATPAAPPAAADTRSR